MKVSGHLVCRNRNRLWRAKVKEAEWQGPCGSRGRRGCEGRVNREGRGGR